MSAACAPSPPTERFWAETITAMSPLRIFSLVVAAAALVAGTAAAEPEVSLAGSATNPPAGMVLVPAGIYRPLFRSPDDLKEVPVAGFALDAAPVTNAEFLEFVRANPKWRRSQVKRLFADPAYLAQWAGDTELGPNTEPLAEQPVANVSWFATKAYAAWRGKRLPSTAEWELAASAGFNRPDGAADPEYRRAIARWYGSPTPVVLPAAQSGPTNVFGLRNLHGLVWEWTSDFNSALITGDARGDTGIERSLFCGAGSQGASDRSNYPAFMRFGLRSSLKAAYTLHNLGFRCAQDGPARTLAENPSKL